MKWLQNIFLTLVAWTALLILWIILMAGSIVSLVCAKLVYGAKGEPLSAYFYELACVLDQLGNVVGGPVWNAWFFKDDATPVAKFGSRKHTMSMIFGINDSNDFTRHGRFWRWFIEWVDPGHLKRAARNFLET